MTTNRSDDIQDDLLVLMCQQGDRAAFDRLADRWQQRLLNFACRLLGDREAALDAVQETWLAAIRGMVRLHDVARFRPWIFATLVHKCRDQSRKTRGQSATALADPHGVVPSRITSAAEDRVEAALQRLPPPNRSILVLRYVEDFSVREIGEILGIPEGTVKSRLHHARNRMRQLLEGDDRWTNSSSNSGGQ